MKGYIVGHTLFSVVAKDRNTAERRIQIDILASKKSYRKRDPSKIGWIPGKRNAVDAPSKEVFSEISVLYKLIFTKKTELKLFGWTERTVMSKEGSGEMYECSEGVGQREAG